MRFLISFFLTVFFFFNINAQEHDWRDQISSGDLIWTQIDSNFYNGAFIGDGLQGAMIMQDNKNSDGIRMLLGHYKAISHNTITGWEYINSRIYVGNIVIHPAHKALTQTMRLNILDGEAIGRIGTAKGNINWSVISDRENNVFAVKVVASPDEQRAEIKIREEWGITPKIYLENKKISDYLEHLPPKPVKERNGNTELIINKMKNQGAHVVASRFINENDSTQVLYVSVGTSDHRNVDTAAGEARQEAISNIDAAIDEGYHAIKTRHIEWWNDYMLKGCLMIKEDPYWQKFWWLQIYKFGCTSSESSDNIIDTQGPWIWETAWAGIWWNLNAQLSYFPIYSGNRLEAGKSLINGMNRMYKSGIFHENARSAGANEGIYVGRSGTYKGDATWGDELGNMPWILHNYWKYWKYSGDDRIGYDLFPMLKDNARFLMSKMYTGNDGKWHVEKSRSPEYSDEILFEDANYALMSVDWVLRTLIEMNIQLGINDPQASHWQEVLDNLTSFPENENGFMISPQQGFDMGHRHYSHLLAIYPYHTVTPGGKQDQTIKRSVDRWLTLTEESGNAGYTYTGGCAMKAMLGDGDEALRLLNKLRTDKLQPNTMYAEGGGPVIETPLSGVESINYLVLQSWNDVIKVFPAVPSNWKNITFKNLRAEGAFLVSASLTEGQFGQFSIYSEKGNTCTFVNPWKQKNVFVNDEAGKNVPVEMKGNNYVFSTQAGKTYYVKSKEL
jgi:alpha-L-fucosidase 2